MTLYTPASSDAIREDVLTDIELECRALGIDDPPIQKGTDWWLLATALGKLGMVAYANIEARDAATSELTAVGKDLDEIREALGLPVVESSASTGKIRLTVSGTRTIAKGNELTIGGTRYATSKTVTAIDGTEIDLYALDPGSSGNYPGGTEIKFVAAPLGVDETAQVSYSVPLTGGTDEESDERKRTRILNTRRYKSEAGAGTIGHLRDVAMKALASVQNAYVYPGLGGPSSCLIAVTSLYDRVNKIYSREINDAAVAIVRAAIHGAVPAPDEYVVRTVDDQETDVAIAVTIPDSVLAGGTGNGWLDAVPWPPLTGAETRVTVTSASATTLTVNALTALSPIAGITRIAWWSKEDQEFKTYTVMLSGGGTGAWVLTLDRPIVDSAGVTPSAGEYVSPGMVNAAGYAETWINAMEALGPGEMTSDANRLPRAYREPRPNVESPTDLGALLLKKLVDAHTEITDYSFTYSSPSSPTVPTVNDAPNVLVTRNFGIYPK